MDAFFDSRPRSYPKGNPKRRCLAALQIRRSALRGLVEEGEYVGQGDLHNHHVLNVGVLATVGSLILLQRRRDVDTEFWGRVWVGRLGRWLFKVARAITPTRALPSSLTHRPTELALSMAAEQLYETLPKETRRAAGIKPGDTLTIEVVPSLA